MTSLSSHKSRVNTSAREFLRQQSSEHRGADEPPPDLDRLISQSTDAINAILVAARCPASLRAYIDAVLGIVHAKIKAGQPMGDWFEASDLEIARRALADRADELSILALKKWTQRQRAALLKWQKQSGYTLIECEPGGMDEDRNNHPTRYRVPLLACAAEVLTEAQSDPAFQRDPHLALQSAAEIALAGLPSTPARRERFRRPRRDGAALLQRNTRTIESLFRRNLEILTLKAGLDPDKVILSAREHFEEVVAAARRALDEVIEQAERVKGGDRSPGPDDDPSSNGGSGARSQGSTHTPEPSPMDRSVTTRTGPQATRAARPRTRPAPGREASISSPAPKSVHTPVDTSVQTPGNTSVHTLNNENNGQGTQGGDADPAPLVLPDPVSEAIADLALFESVGAQSFDVTIIGEVKLDSTRKFIDFEKEVPADRLRVMLPGLVERCEREKLNLILRPRAGCNRRLIQLDDLDQAAVDRVRELAFRIVETSPGNYQAWVCVIGADENLERRLKRGVGADVGANGATRVAGSLNVKEQYRESGYPRIRLIAGMPERVASIEDLTELLAPNDTPPCVPSSSVPTHTHLPMPDYDDFLGRAHSTAAGEIDRSAVDFAWSATALKRGHSAATVMSELERISLKAAGLSRKARSGYLRRTVRAVERESW